MTSRGAKGTRSQIRSQSGCTQEGTNQFVPLREVEPSVPLRELEPSVRLLEVELFSHITRTSEQFVLTIPLYSSSIRLSGSAIAWVRFSSVGFARSARLA